MAIIDGEQETEKSREVLDERQIELATGLAYRHGVTF